MNDPRISPCLRRDKSSEWTEDSSTCSPCKGPRFYLRQLTTAVPFRDVPRCRRRTAKPQTVAEWASEIFPEFSSTKFYRNLSRLSICAKTLTHRWRQRRRLRTKTSFWERRKVASWRIRWVCCDSSMALDPSESVWGRQTTAESTTLSSRANIWFLRHFRKVQ